MEKYKIVKEYDRFYLCEHPKGYKECFNKREYKPTEDGYIMKRKKQPIESIGLAPDKVNKSFNNIPLFF